MAAASDQVERFEDQIDELDADERGDDAAEAVDRAASGAGCAAAPSGRYVTPRSASGISRMMMRALKMTADRMALVGRRQPHDVQRRDLREHAP